MSLAEGINAADREAGSVGAKEDVVLRFCGRDRIGMWIWVSGGTWRGVVGYSGVLSQGGVVEFVSRQVETYSINAGMRACVSV